MHRLVYGHVLLVTRLRGSRFIPGERRAAERESRSYGRSRLSKNAWNDFTLLAYPITLVQLRGLRHTVATALYPVGMVRSCEFSED